MQPTARPLPENHVFPADAKAWRAWLRANHGRRDAVWLVYRKGPEAALRWADAVDEALCFGWIDSRAKPLDGQRYMQYFCRRKPDSAWSAINKEKVDRLLAAGKMRPVGLRSIALAKENGSWTFLDGVEALLLPEDLALYLAGAPAAAAFFEGLSKSTKKQLLLWLLTARTAPTRAARLQTVADCLAGRSLPAHLRR